MRMLNIASGVAVLLVTLAYTHLLHHFYTNAAADDVHNPVFVTGMCVGIVVGIFAVTGGVLLIRRGRGKQPAESLREQTKERAQ